MSCGGHPLSCALGPSGHPKREDLNCPAIDDAARTDRILIVGGELSGEHGNELIGVEKPPFPYSSARLNEIGRLPCLANPYPMT